MLSAEYLVLNAYVYGLVKGSHKMTALLYDYIRGAECCVLLLSAKYLVLSADCGVLSAGFY